MTATDSVFSEDYAITRQRFCEAARERSWQLRSHPRSSGREDELFTDVAFIGSKSPRKLLVLSSGLHGIEGFHGSAIQQQILQSLDVNKIAGTDSAVVLIHALNPFGFARLRRGDENNVDTNRNFLLSEEEYRGTPQNYEQICSLLNPTKWPKRELPVRLQALAKITKYGYKNIQQAIAGGQYDFPHGLFYGGTRPSETMAFTEQVLLPMIQEADTVLHLDIHSGLGKLGQYQALLGHDLSPNEMIWANNLFQRNLSVNNDSEHYQARGSLSRWVRFHAPHAVSACWEFGTYDPITVLAALRAENAAYHWGDRSSKDFDRTKEKLKEAFCPRSISWRQSVLDQAEQLLDRVVQQWLLQ